MWSLRVFQDEHRPVHNVHLRGSMAGCQRGITSDHHQLMAGILHANKEEPLLHSATLFTGPSQSIG